MAVKTNKLGNINNGVITKKPDMKLFMEAAKAKLEMEGSQIVSRTIVAVDAAMPEIKCLGRNAGCHLAIGGVKLLTDTIIGQNEITDGLAKLAHGGVAVNSMYNGIVGYNKGKKAYKEATDEDVERIMNKALEVKENAKRFKEQQEQNNNQQDIIEVEEASVPNTVTVENINANDLAALNNMSDEEILAAVQLIKQMRSAK